MVVTELAEQEEIDEPMGQQEAEDRQPCAWQESTVVSGTVYNPGNTMRVELYIKLSEQIKLSLHAPNVSPGR